MKTIKKSSVVDQIVSDLQAQGNVSIAEHSAKFFRTEKGGYGEGDRFLGIRVPNIRATAKKWNIQDVATAEQLLNSEYHEVRFLASIALLQLYPKHKNDVYHTYMSHIGRGINNWDIIDTSTPHIVGKHLLDHRNAKRILNELATSSNLWHRRVAVLATFTFIRAHNFEHTLRLSEMLLNDSHDLIHKATGWMLREVGKRDVSVLNSFLDRHAAIMPRTMLRYAIEKLSLSSRTSYLAVANVKKRKKMKEEENSNNAKKRRKKKNE